MSPSSKAHASKSNGTTPSDTSMTDYTDRANGRKAAADDNDSVMVRRLPPYSLLRCPICRRGQREEGQLRNTFADHEALVQSRDARIFGGWHRCVNLYLALQFGLTRIQDSDTNPNTTATSDAEGVFQPDGRKRRIEATNLRKSVFGKKHNRLDESKVGCLACGA